MKKWWMHHLTVSGKCMKGILFFLTVLSTQLMAQDTLQWKMFHPVKKEWILAGTHGSVQEMLISTGELPDPFYGKNEEKFGWVEDHVWEFVCEFNVSDEQFKKEYIELEFPGIDTYADIYLNDSLIGFAQNAFRPYFFQVKDKIKSGKNILRVVFTSPIMYHREAYEKAKYKLPAPNDVDSIAIAPYTRKPQYQFGWDWALRMNTIGFLKPVKLNAYQGNKIRSINITTISIDDNAAELAFEIQLVHPVKTPMTWESDLFGPIDIVPGETRITRRETVQQPRLWWPKGQGSQELYSDSWVLKSNVSGAAEILDKRDVRFGIRTSELINEADKWGTAYVIKVNGREVFCKGGDYIPQDIFPSRVNDSDLRKMVETMAAANFNMVRVWGGGYYPDEEFFNACDELGIMVWQDFMFACAMYPGDPDFLANVKEEVEYQVSRISSHPSLTIFNGNNEVDVAWKNWGFQLKYGLYGASSKEIEDSYDRLFKQLLPNQVARFTNSPYIHTSPLSNWGKDEFYNHGTQHYWGVWHGKDPMENFAKKIGRFNAEYGFQSFPEYSTLLTFSQKTEWDLDSDVMKHHQKSYVGNGMIMKHAKILYGEPASFEDFVYYSQLTQATAVSMAVTGHRLDAPRCMGTLYWQVNDCWPAPTWSSVDYYGNWKALHYWVKDDYEDVAVLSKLSDAGEREFYLVSSQPDTFMCELFFTVYDLNGKELFKNNASQLIRGNEAEKICDHCIKKDAAGANYYVRFDWKDQHGKQHFRTFSHTPQTYTRAIDEDISISFGDIDQTSRTVKIIVDVKKFLKNFWIYSSKAGNEFDRNFMDLIPGRHVVTMKFEELPQLSDLGFKWM
jgi:beta-mannosidase